MEQLIDVDENGVNVRREAITNAARRMRIAQEKLLLSMPEIRRGTAGSQELMELQKDEINFVELFYTSDAGMPIPYTAYIIISSHQYGFLSE